MPVCKGGKRFGDGKITGGNIVVKRFEGLFEGIIVPFVMAAGIGDVGVGGVGNQTGIAYELLVGLVAISDPQIVGLFAVPGDGAI